MHVKLLLGISLGVVFSILILVVILFSFQSSVGNKSVSVSTVSSISSVSSSTTSVTSTVASTSSTTSSVTSSYPLRISVINVTNATALSEVSNSMLYYVYINVTNLGSNVVEIVSSNFYVITSSGIYSSCNLSQDLVSVLGNVSLESHQSIVGGLFFNVPSNSAVEGIEYKYDGEILGVTYFKFFISSYISSIDGIYISVPNNVSNVVSASPNQIYDSFSGFNWENYSFTFKIVNILNPFYVELNNIVLCPHVVFTSNVSPGTIIPPNSVLYVRINFYLPKESYYGSLNVFANLTLPSLQNFFHVKVLNVTYAPTIHEIFSEGTDCTAYVVYMNISYYGNYNFTIISDYFNVTTNEGNFSSVKYYTATIYPVYYPGELLYYQLSKGEYVVGGVVFFVPNNAVLEKVSYYISDPLLNMKQFVFSVDLPNVTSYMSYINLVYYLNGNLTDTNMSSLIFFDCEVYLSNVTYSFGNITITNYGDLPLNISLVSVSPNVFKVETIPSVIIIPPKSTKSFEILLTMPNKVYSGNVNITLYGYFVKAFNGSYYVSSYFTQKGLYLLIGNDFSVKNSQVELIFGYAIGAFRENEYF